MGEWWEDAGMSATHPLYRKFKQVVEAGITCADDERFAIHQQKFLRLIGATETEWEHLRKLSENEGEYLVAVHGSELIFTRSPAAP